MSDVNVLLALQKLTDKLMQGFDFKDFFTGVMQAFDLSKFYIENAWDNDPRSNCANSDGSLGLMIHDPKLAREDIGIQKRALFRFVKQAEDVREQLDLAVSSPCFNNKNFKIPVVIAVSPELISIFNAIENEYFSFELDKLPQYVGALLPLSANYKRIEIKTSTQADEKACRKLTVLMEKIERFNELSYDNRHDLNDFMRRLVFCLFAEDTGLFEQGLFTKTFAKLVGFHGEGSEEFFKSLFLVLNTPLEQRDFLRVNHELLAFPYVGGELFSYNTINSSIKGVPHNSTNSIKSSATDIAQGNTQDTANTNTHGAVNEDSDSVGNSSTQKVTQKGSLFIPKINFAIREDLINCGRIEWNRISPAIFGSMFQYALDPSKRRQEGAHYTSEQNILKLIRPLFLDELTQQVEELENQFKALQAAEIQNATKSAKLDGGATVKKDGSTTKELDNLKARAQSLQDELSNFKIMDPACGCGNFLIVTYRELRRLENRLLKLIQQEGSIMQEDLVKVSIEQFYGIEIEDWPVEIAQLSMWLMQHQMNLETAEVFGAAPPSLPLTKSAHIHCANALTTDWNDILRAVNCSYLIGNPPFGGAVTISKEQKEWLQSVYPDKYPIKFVDFVSGWFVKAADYMLANNNCRAAFVSTNSICQGQQVNTLWGLLLKQGIVINFAYTSFRWNNEAINAAKVFCIIVGFSYQKINPAVIFEEQPDGAFLTEEVENLSPYLIDEPTCTIVKAESEALSAKNPIKFGNMTQDQGALILDIETGNRLISAQDPAAKVIKLYMGSEELCNNTLRYCLWMTNFENSDWEQSEFIVQRVERCRSFREGAIKTGAAYKNRETPWLFGQLAYKTPPKAAIVIPRHTSEKRPYVPVGIVDSNTVISDAAFLIPDANMYDYAMMNSRMHNVWMRFTSGRLEERYRYSRDLTYNTFIWPELNEQRKLELSILGTRIFDFCSSSKMSLGDLNDPKLMPIELKLLHEQLDALVESYYRDEPFTDDNERLAFLIGLYRKRLDEVEQEQAESKSKSKVKTQDKGQTSSDISIVATEIKYAENREAENGDAEKIEPAVGASAVNTTGGACVAGKVINANTVVPWLTPLNAQHIMVTGSSLDDGGALQLDENQTLLLLSSSQKEASSYIHRLINSQAFYEYSPRYALWIDVAKEEAEEEEHLKALAKAQAKAEAQANKAKAKASKSRKGKTSKDDKESQDIKGKDSQTVAVEQSSTKPKLQNDERFKARITWRQIPAIMDQVEKCRVFRTKSEHTSTAYRNRFKAFSYSNVTYPPLRQKKLMLPRFVRKDLGYIPTWFSCQPYVIDDSVCIIPTHDILDCALINSRMHWLWLEFTAKLDEHGVYHYSVEQTYNTFIHPYVSSKLREKLTRATSEFLDLTNCYAERYGAALNYATASEEIINARQRMDELVERCYRTEAFHDDTERLEFLKQLYLQYKF